MHMRYFGVIFLLLIFLSCSDQRKQQTDNISTSEQNTLVQDTVVHTWDARDELAGSLYRTQAKGYQLVAGNDTSDFKCYLTKGKGNGRVSMTIGFLKTKSYKEQSDELEGIVPFAFDNFQVNNDSFQSISLGRLIETGDLCIEISRQYQSEFGYSEKLPDSKRLNDIFLRSKLAADWNSLLKNFDLEVVGTSTEKIFFTDGTDIFSYSMIESDTAAIPSKIVDCILWVSVKPARP
jgi:hypothetical protein